MNFHLRRIYRRLLVLVFIGGILGGLVVRTFAPELDALSKTLQILGPVCGAFLFGWSWTSLNPHGLDEREHQVRYHVYFHSYLLLSFVVLIPPVLLGLIYLVSEPTTRGLIATLLASLQAPGDFMMMLVALIPLVGLLPSAMLAWLQPDPLEDDSVTHIV